MKSAGFSTEMYILIYILISNLKNGVYSSALDCLLRILNLYVPYIKIALKIVNELRNFLVIVEKCMKSRNFMPITEKLTITAIDLAAAVSYRENIPFFSNYDINVSLLEPIE